MPALAEDKALRTFLGGAGLAARNLADQVADQISAAILSGELKPGERLGEERVARALGVSRGPVREAARLLTERGLVVQHPRRGFFVRTFTAAEIDDLYDMRLAIEQHALRRAVSQVGWPALEAALAARLDDMRAAADTGDVRQLADADLALHRALAELSGNARLVRTFGELSGELTILIGLIGRHYERPDELVASHLPLVEAVRRRGLAAALAAIERHIVDARDNMRRHFSRSSAIAVATA